MTSKKQEWKVLKSKIKNKFDKFSSSDIEELHGHMERLTDKVQEVYQYDRTKAEKECQSFNNSLKQ